MVHFQFFCSEQCDCCLGSISVVNKPPTTQWLKQQSFNCSGIWAGLSWAVFLLLVASAVVPDEAESLAGAGTPWTACLLRAGLAFLSLPSETPLLCSLCPFPFHVISPAEESGLPVQWAAEADLLSLFHLPPGHGRASLPLSPRQVGWSVQTSEVEQTSSIYETAACGEGGEELLTAVFAENLPTASTRRSLSGECWCPRRTLFEWMCGLLLHGSWAVM